MMSANDDNSAVEDSHTVFDGTNIFDVIDAFNDLNDEDNGQDESSNAVEEQNGDEEEEYGNVLSKRGLVVSSKRRRRAKVEYSDDDKADEGGDLSYVSADYPERKIKFLYSKNRKYPGYKKSSKDYYKHRLYRWKYGLSYYMKDPSGKTVVTMRRSKSTDTKLKLYWKMKHLDPRCRDGPDDDTPNSCGVSINENSGMYAACKFKETIGDQKFVGKDNAWLDSFYVTDKYGESKGVSKVNVGLNLFENMGCVVVYYNYEGERMSCGVLRAYYDE
eukprot:CAMPEP_0116025190 /NCGR_PEP_ID=MMETSP0321-20121206/12877_1 /TAXON_ID=163516 /ORGANISM="Leptocylindrus danicus var. danicus, Strain B650" /LENGTH=273 /DNA_ID=CAMNT_0003497289 /DNA_START=534 /DNA_END=1355 /DNA_ORIENTATION=+